MPHDPINLPVLVADTMAQHPDASRDELEAALINGVETTVGRRLTEYEKAKIGVELGVQWNTRHVCERCGETDGHRAGCTDEDGPLHALAGMAVVA